MSKKRPRVLGMRKPPSQRTPSWKVNLIGFGFCEDPDCTADHGIEDDPAEAFAYTSGLHQGHHLPELHMPAAPDGGEGEPLPYQLVGSMLNTLADDLIGGSVHAGGSVAFEDTSGADTIICTLGEPVPRDDMQAFVAHPRAEVIPVTWTTTPARGHTHDRSLTIGAREGAQIAYVTYTGERADDGDSGFTLEYEGAPPPWEWTQEVMGVVCMGCLIEHHPDVGPGLDLARKHGSAELVDGNWVKCVEEAG